jgi:hypothetical protein
MACCKANVTFTFLSSVIVIILQFLYIKNEMYQFVQLLRSFRFVQYILHGIIE